MADAAARGTPTQAAADRQAASAQPNPGQSTGVFHHSGEPTAELGGTSAAAMLASAGGEQWSRSLATGTSRALAPEQALELTGKQTDAGAANGATDGAGARSPRDLPAAASHDSASVSVAGTAPASLPVGPMPGIGRDRVAEARDLPARRAPETRAADPAAAYRVAAEGEDASATLFAGRDMSSGDRDVDPEHMPGQGSDTAAESADRSPDATSATGQGTLAFQALLVPAPVADSRRADPEAREEGGASSGRAAAREASGSSAAGRSGVRSSRDEDPSLQGPAQPSLAGRVSQAEPAAHGFSGTVPAESTAGADRAASQQAPNSQHTASLAAPDLSAWEPALLPHKSSAGGAAREIQLELRDDDARVNVRLVERAGSVQVDVRTPDTHLAGALRQDLPALTSRLEQTGLRAEAWHDAPASAAARIRTAEPSAGAGFQSSQNPSREGGGHHPRDGPPKEKQQKQNQPKSKEFSWLYTSLQ